MMSKHNISEIIPTQKVRKQTVNLRKKHPQTQNKPTFGICFDCDGVLARGTLPVAAAQKAFHKITNEKGEFKVPVTFMTNALNRNTDKANQISKWFNVPISPDQMIQAQGPLDIFTKFHDKRCLIVGQGKILDIARECGFKNMVTIEEISEAYPLLDMVDHDNRDRIAAEGYTEKEIPRIEAVILMGEPARWESSLQLIIDLLKTDGKPNKAPEASPEKHLPVIACNMDLQFMDRACMPRYGHGAYLLCLEALYKKCTGRELKYTALIGKPSEISFRYCEHVLTKEAKKLGFDEPLKTMYLIGDTPEVDMVGANLYQRYVDRLRTGRLNNVIEGDKDSKHCDHVDPALPESRNVPHGSKFLPQTIDTCDGLLVCTGCYTPGDSPELEGDEKNYLGHRDFPRHTELYKPVKILNDVNDCIDHIFEKEGFCS